MTVPRNRRAAATSPILVQSQAAFDAVIARFTHIPRVALDTEAASFHRYVDRVYLVQLSSDSETVVVDPLAVNDIGALGTVLLDAGTEVVLHDADYDLRILDRDYGFRARRLFDTRIAAQLAGEPSVGLATLLETHFGVRVNKKFQRADWSGRPLSSEMIEYAADDTRHLIALRDRLERRLGQLGRAAWAREEFLRLEDVRWTGPNEADDEAYQRLKGAKVLRPRALAILRALYAWREATAQRLDRAPFRVLGNAALIGIARAAPRDAKQLETVADLPRTLARRHGRALLDAVRQGLGVAEPELPRIKRARRPDVDAGYDERLERLKVLRNERAAAVALDPGLVCPNGTLQAIARLRPTTPTDLDGIEELRGWQREVVGDAAILAAIA